MRDTEHQSDFLMVTSTGWSIGLTATQYRVVWQVYGEGSAETVEESELISLSAIVRLTRVKVLGITLS